MTNEQLTAAVLKLCQGMDALGRDPTEVRAFLPPLTPPVTAPPARGGGGRPSHDADILRGADSLPVVPVLTLATPSVGVRVDDGRHFLLASTAHHFGAAAATTPRPHGVPWGRAYLRRPVRRGRREPFLVGLCRRQGGHRVVR
jgi:hypothetical protein